VYFQVLLRIEITPYIQVVPCPGKKAFASPKSGDPSLPEAGFRRFSPGISLPPHLFAETKRGELERFLPALFGFDASFLARATRRRVWTTSQIGDKSNILGI
jgi:hypothetical protein